MKIGGILVTYNPNIELLTNVIASVNDQVDSICLIDNSPYPVKKDFLKRFKNLVPIFLKKNMGIAAAQNLGLEYFQNLQYDYILFFDQDSILPKNIVKGLLTAYQLLENNGFKVAVVGPKAVNRDNNKPYKEKYPVLSRFSIKNKIDNIIFNFEMVNSCLSSSSLISINNFNRIGLMESNLFIDGVDNEWCWRAKSKCKLDSFVVCNFAINHKLGEGDKSLFGFKIAIASPFRVYYEFRNYFLLCNRDYVPVAWKYINGVKYFIKIFYFPIAVAPRLKYLSSIYNGIKDGFSSYFKNNITK